MLQSLRTVEFVHHRERRRTRHGISGVSAPHTPNPDRIDHLRFTHHRGEWQPVGQTLGQDEQIRRHPGLLTSEKRSGPTEARLDLVENQHHAMLIAPFAKHAQKRGRHRDEPALAGHRFDDHRRHIRLADVGLGDFGEPREGLRAQTPRQRTRQLPRTNRRLAVHPRPAVKIRERRAINFRRKRTEPTFVRIRLPGQSHRHIGAPMKGMLETNHRLALSVSAGKLDCIFHRLRPRAGQKRFLGKIPRRPLIEPPRHVHIALVGHHIDARVEKFVGLRLGRRHD